MPAAKITAPVMSPAGVRQVPTTASHMADSQGHPGRPPDAQAVGDPRPEAPRPDDGQLDLLQV